MKFEVRALRQGRVQTLQMEAGSKEELQRQLQDQHLELLSLREVRGTWLKGRRFDLGLFSQELSELLEAGLSVSEAVDALAHQQIDADVAKVYFGLEQSLRQGLPLSSALAQSPHLFPPLFVGLMRAAEQTSDLKAALARYMEYSGRLDGLRNKIVSALIYPAILAGVGGGVVVFLLTFVVPRFAAVYRDAGRDLPLLSRWLLEWGAFAHGHATELLLVSLSLLTSLVLLGLRLWRNGQLETLVALLPGVSRRIHLFRLSRLYLTLGTLLNGGMPMVQALSLAQGVVAGRHRGQVAAVIDALRRGAAISQALAQQQLTTPVSARLLAAGEGTGQMAELFIRAGRYHDTELGRWVERFSRSFEPVLMVGIGLLIGGIVVLLYMPIFDLAGGFR